MARPAVAALEEARERAAALLWPPVVRRWLRLAVLVGFVGGAGSIGSAAGNLQLPATGSGSLPQVPTAALDPSRLPPVETLVRWLVVLGAVLAALALGYAVVGAVAEFALVGALGDGDVRLRASARRYAGRGLRLFAFRAVVVGLALLVGGGPVALVGWAAFRATPALGVLVVPALAVAGVVALCAWVVLTLTTDLVVPAILAAGVPGPLAGWRRVWSVVAANPVETGLYLLLRVVLGVAGRVVVGLAGSLVALVAGVPFAVAGAAALAVAGAALSLVEVGVLAALGLGFALVVLALLQVVRTPVVCFLRAYAVATLGGLSADLALFVETDGHESVDDG
ncbi:MAG: hypothetical protein ABEJ43_04230 [Haloferacaceae archaeon]